MFGTCELTNIFSISGASEDGLFETQDDGNESVLVAQEQLAYLMLHLVCVESGAHKIQPAGGSDNLRIYSAPISSTSPSSGTKRRFDRSQTSGSEDGTGGAGGRDRRVVIDGFVPSAQTAEIGASTASRTEYTQP